jgi:hypothetical protein
MNLPLSIDVRSSRRRCWLMSGVVLTLVPVSVDAQTVRSVSNLSFGTFVSTTAGTVTVATNGGRSNTGGAYVLNQGGSASAAQLTIKGAPHSSYAITLPANGTVTLSDGKGHSMAVGNFVSVINGAGGPAGTVALDIGATLSVNQSQARGGYTGSFNVIVNYQ